MIVSLRKIDSASNSCILLQTHHHRPFILLYLFSLWKVIMMLTFFFKLAKLWTLSLLFTSWPTYFFNMEDVFPLTAFSSACTCLLPFVPTLAALPGVWMQSPWGSLYLFNLFADVHHMWGLVSMENNHESRMLYPTSLLKHSYVVSWNGCVL